MAPTTHFSLVGPGRAGTAVATGLIQAGRSLVTVAGRPDSPSTSNAAERLAVPAVPIDAAGTGAGLVIVATPDSAIPAAALAVAPSLDEGALVVHLAGSVGVEVFEALHVRRPDVRIAAMHPLQTLAGHDDDAERLRGAWFAVEGDPEVGSLVEALGGHPFVVSNRVLYHAAAVIASNHLVALMGQVERVAAAAGVPAQALDPLVRATLSNVASQGAAASLTGPVARGDVATVARHLDALPPGERRAYRALAREALRLVGHADRDLEALLDEREAVA